MGKLKETMEFISKRKVFLKKKASASKNIWENLLLFMEAENRQFNKTTRIMYSEKAFVGQGD